MVRGVRFGVWCGVGVLAAERKSLLSDGLPGLKGWFGAPALPSISSSKIAMKLEVKQFNSLQDVDLILPTESRIWPHVTDEPFYARRMCKAWSA